MFFTQPPFDEPRFNQPSFMLERRVNRPVHIVARALRDPSTVAPANGFPLGEHGTLLVDETPRPASHPMLPGHPSWQTTGQLLSRRGRLVARVDVEVSSWAPESIVVQIRPRDHNPHRWTARRTRRYFALAHAGADQLERALNTASAPPAETPLVTRREVPAVTIRPIEPQDVDGLRGLFWQLSPESRYFRFLSPVIRPGEGYLRHLAEVDHRDRDALVASVDNQVVAVARYDRDSSQPAQAEVAVVVADAWHRQGIATALLQQLGLVASTRGVEHFIATVAAENRAVPKLVKSLPVDATWNWDQGQRYLDVDLSCSR